jgi:hypothetical protein
MREPTVAGSFYSSDKKELKKEVEKYLDTKKENIKAGISPHAGYIYSGKLAGKVIGSIIDKKNFIILGVNHSGIGENVSFSLQDFETPLGIAKNNKPFTEKIIQSFKKEKFDVGINEEAHNAEHSIEVQIPFLQLSQKKFEITPILFKELSYEECKKAAEILSKYIDNNVCILVSSDFTHYGKSYGFVPFTNNIKDKMYKLDNEVLFEILRLDSKGVFDKAIKTTICGLYGITIITEIAKINKLKAKIVDYYTSGDITGDYTNSVGYAGVVFY